MLNRIVEIKKQEVKDLQRSLDISRFAPGSERIDPFQVFMEPSRRVRIISEIKQASPVKGLLCTDFDPEKLARTYAENGAAAISCITDQKFFQGSREYLPLVKQTSGLPVLRKDFIIDQVQLYETLLLGADLVLLIAALHDYPTLLSLSEKCLELGIEPLLEIHAKEELQEALDLPVRIIGINNRNLKDFTVNLQTSLNLADDIPDNYIKVSESGIHAPADMVLLEEYGFDAALIGEALVSSGQPGDKLKELAFYRGDDHFDPC